MSWKFDPFEEDIVWVNPISIFKDIGDIDMGDLDSDIAIDLGFREDTPSGIDQGLRVYDGDI